MCCINVDPLDFMKWAKPVIEKKEAILDQARKAIAAEKAAYNSLPWFKRLFTQEPGTGWDRFRYWDNHLRIQGCFKLPTVGEDKYIPLAGYCTAKGIKMPLPTNHDFFKG